MTRSAEDPGQAGPHPRRILLLSADMGAGHNATARAVEQAARRLWPECETRWADTLDVMGPGVGPVFRRIYVTNVQTTPWLYEFFYGSLWRFRWFASASKRFVGAWAGRRLAPLIEEYDPDLIVSTYPLGSAGLAWLREQGRLDVPVAAWVSDFAPHPFWVYHDIDMHFVMHSACLPAARAAEPGVAVTVAAPPVVDAFGPGDRAAARHKLGLDQDAFIALLSCGYFGFGTVEKAVDTLLAADQRVQVVAVCGHNEQLRRRLLARGAPEERLLALGWVDDMPTYTVACDVVVTNAGGATSLEALSCGRTVMMFEPIAAHGRANAELMASAGLAVLSRTSGELERAVRALLSEPERLAALEEASLTHARSRTKEDDLRLVAAISKGSRSAGRPAGAGRRSTPDASRPQRAQPEDAFFLYAQTPEVAQVVGGAAIFDGRLGVDDVVATIKARKESLPNLYRRLAPGRVGWWRPVWVDEDDVDVRAHVREHVLEPGAGLAAFETAVGAFCSTPVDLARPPWEILLVHGLPGDRSAGIFKLHHVLGDGVAVIDTLAGLLDTSPHPPTSEGAAPRPPLLSRPSRRSRSSRSSPGRAAATAVGAAAQRTRRIAAGVWALARTPFAPRSGLNGPMRGARRRYVSLSLPAADVRATARGLGAGTSELLLTVVAGALDRLLTGRGERTAGRTLRAMVPRTVRTGGTLRAPGNITAAVQLDLPLGPISPRFRLEQVQGRMRRRLDQGQPEASRFLMRAMGVLPAPLHARIARIVYTARFFNLIVSVIPGPRRPYYFAGKRLAEVYPVLPVADRVGLAVGLMAWGDSVGVGVTADPHLVPDVDKFAAAIGESFTELRRAAGE